VVFGFRDAEQVAATGAPAGNDQVSLHTGVMMSLTQHSAIRPTMPEPVERKARPVVLWAVVGAACIALTVYEWTAWIVRGHAKPAPVGASEMPRWMEISLIAWQIVFPLAALVVIYRFLVRPWIRERTLTFDGMFLIAWFSAWAMQDSWFNYSRQWFNYNAALFNLGCPQCEVPGWQSPHGERMAEPLFTASLYIFALFGGCVLCNYIMRRAKQRWPRIGVLGLVGVALASMAVADLIAEVVWARTGTYSYVAAIPGVSLFSGHYYQFPLTQMIIWGFPWAFIACVRYFKNDRGETLAERGISQVHLSSGKKTGIRLLATIGIVNTIFFVASNIPNQFFGTHAGAVPRDVIERTYFLNGQCGPGTDQACPGPKVPMPVGPDSAHLTPQGTLSTPAGLPEAP
jgi:uncharacterized membrane protein YhdT